MFSRQAREGPREVKISWFGVFSVHGARTCGCCPPDPCRFRMSTIGVMGLRQILVRQARLRHFVSLSLSSFWRAGLVEGLSCLSLSSVWGPRADGREFVSMPRLSRLFVLVSGRKEVWLGAGACAWIFSSVMLFFLLCSRVSLGSRIFAATFGLNALFLFLGVFLAQGTLTPPFVPAVGLIHSCPANVAALTPQHPGPCLQTYCRRRRHRRRRVVRAERRPWSS